jgi:hypothetical protein
MECCKQSLDHRRLNPIMNPWPGRRVEPDLQIGAEDVAKRNENAEARLSTACLDLREISMVDPRSSGERPLRQVRVDTQPANLFADAPPQVADGAPQQRPGTVASRRCTGHG